MRYGGHIARLIDDTLPDLNAGSERRISTPAWAPPLAQILAKKQQSSRLPAAPARNTPAPPLPPPRRPPETSESSQTKRKFVGMASPKGIMRPDPVACRQAETPLLVKSNRVAPVVEMIRYCIEGDGNALGTLVRRNLVQKVARE